MGGTQAPLTGDIFLEGRSFTTYTEKEISRKIGLVLTDRTMAGGLTVFDLVSLGRHPHTGFFGRLQKRDEEIVYQSLDAVGVAFKAESYVAELSDGERQKVMIAKALAQECPLLLLDEPTAFLDVVSRIEMMDLLHELAEKKGKTVLLSTHDLDRLCCSEIVYGFYPATKVWSVVRRKIWSFPEKSINFLPVTKLYLTGKMETFVLKNGKVKK